MAHEPAGEDWYGFAGVQALGDDVLLVPLRGHSRGHCGVAVRREDGGWLLHAGDAYFWHGEVDTPPTRKPGLTMFQKMMSVEEELRTSNQQRLRELRVHHPDVTVFCAHDALDLERLSG